MQSRSKKTVWKLCVLESGVQICILVKPVERSIAHTGPRWRCRCLLCMTDHCGSNRFRLLSALSCSQSCHPVLLCPSLSFSLAVCLCISFLVYYFVSSRLSILYWYLYSIPISFSVFYLNSASACWSFGARSVKNVPFQLTWVGEFASAHMSQKYRAAETNVHGFPIRKEPGSIFRICCHFLSCHITSSSLEIILEAWIQAKRVF